MTLTNTRDFLSTYEMIGEAIEAASRCLLNSANPEENVAGRQKVEIRLDDLAFISPLVCKQGQGFFSNPTIDIF
jgi:hypothetical protein